MTIGGAVARAIADGTRVQALAAEFVGVDGELASLVGPDGQRFTASRAVAGWPSVGSVVWVLVVGDQRLMLASPTEGPSPWGRVVSVGTGNVTAASPPDSEDPPTTFLLARGATAEVGDLVHLTREHGGLVLAVYPTSTGPAPAPTPAPDAPRQRIERTAEVNATWDGTVTPAGYWIRGDDLYTRNSGGGPNYATIGYGDRVGQLVPAGARVLSAAVYMDVRALGSTHEAGTHTLAGASGIPAPAHTFEVIPRDGWLPVPVDAAQTLADGGVGGLTFYGGAGTIYGALRRNPGNGRLRVHYESEV